MRSKKERLDILEDIKPDIQGSCLVVGIDKKGNIKKCNELFEKLIGTQIEDVRDAPFSTFLSKNSSIIDSWMDVLLKMKDDEHIPELELPLQTKTGEDVIISWTNFPLKSVEDDNKSVLNLVGMPVFTSATKDNKNNKVAKKGEEQKKKNTQQDTKKTTAKPNKQSASKTSNESEVQQMTDIIKETSKKKSKKAQKEKPKKEKKSKKKFGIKHSKKSSNQLDGDKDNSQLDIDQELNVGEIDQDVTSNDIYEQQQKEKLKSESLKNKRILFKKSSKRKDKENEKLDDIENQEEIKSKKSFSLHKKITKHKDTDISYVQDEKSFKNQIKDLEKQNKKLQQEINNLEKKIESIELNRKNVKTLLNKKLLFLKNCMSIDKRRDEFNYMMDQMNQRKQKLEHLETDMILEKKEFKKKIEEFFTWREKLEQLEQEIEKRRNYLAEHEAFLNENFDKVLQHELNSPAQYFEKHIIQDNDEDIESQGVVEEEDLFESLTVEAVVLQRGRIKKANSLFQQMIGFDEKDLVGKHLVDFVGPSGLAGVEQHYVNRLKGVDDLSYDTVFLSNKEQEIPVHVKVKSGEFQGQRAEIATFREK